MPEQEIEAGKEEGQLLVLGWGSTYGTIKSVVLDLVSEGVPVAHSHLRYLRPFPKNLGDMLKKFDRILIPEINNGQLIKVIKEKFDADTIGYNKIHGLPMTEIELKTKILETLKEN